ncbi:hypothetical protein EDB89DRAFT_1134624 [Lactarius sanguifluus]|nr:hypothetical protein EDB89DRAFT_1134624 [Lactarius sanguifluus]
MPLLALTSCRHGVLWAPPIFAGLQHHAQHVFKRNQGTYALRTSTRWSVALGVAFATTLLAQGHVRRSPVLPCAARVSSERRSHHSEPTRLLASRFASQCARAWIRQGRFDRIDSGRPFPLENQSSLTVKLCTTQASYCLIFFFSFSFRLLRISRCSHLSHLSSIFFFLSSPTDLAMLSSFSFVVVLFDFLFSFSLRLSTDLAMLSSFSFVVVLFFFFFSLRLSRISCTS